MNNSETYPVYIQPNIKTELFNVSSPKDIIEWELSCFAPDTKVVATQMTEDGWVVVLEGEPEQVDAIAKVWGY